MAVIGEPGRTEEPPRSFRVHLAPAYPGGSRPKASMPAATEKCILPK